MNKLSLTMVFVLALLNQGYTQQTEQAPTFYSVHHNIDTLLSNQFYEAEIEIDEFTRFVKVKKRKYEEILIPEDSLFRTLLIQLITIGISADMVIKAKILEVTDRYGYRTLHGPEHQPMKRIRYKISDLNREQVESLADSIHFTGLSKIRVVPTYHASSFLQSVQKSMEDFHFSLCDKEANEYALKHRQKVIKRSNISQNFYEVPHATADPNYKGIYDISFEPRKYNFFFMINYELK